MENSVNLAFTMSESSIRNSVIEPDKISTEINSTHTDEIHMLLKFGLIQTANPSISAIVHYICNTDGTIRWMWPAKSSKPNFIHFYTASNFKSRIFVWAAKSAFACGLGAFFKQGKLELKGFEFTSLTNWAVFTGTVGPNRKAILRIQNNSGDVEFRKLPFSAVAKQNLIQENRALLKLKSSQAERFFDYPFSTSLNEDEVFGQTSLIGNHAVSVPLPNQLDLIGFTNWLSDGLQQSAPDISISTFQTQKFDPEFCNNLEQLKEFCTNNPLSVSAPVHGDFTPWNCRMNDSRLQIFDWEMFMEKGIPLEDLFHYCYQQAILVDRISFAQLRSRIQDMLTNPAVDAFLKYNKLHPRLLEMHYLNRLCTYYLNVYSNQDKWHVQINWLIDIWAQSVRYLLAVQDSTVRKTVLSDFQNTISGLEYALLKFNLSELALTPATSDIDLCTNRDAANQMIQLLQNHPWVNVVKIKNLIKMLQLEVVLLDGSRIDLDLIFQFKRHHIVYLDAEKVLANRIISPNGISNASPECNRDYVLRFYTLNGSAVPEKHLFWTHHQLSNEEQKQLIQNIRVSPENSGFSKIKNRIGYWFEIVQNMRSEKGFLITFSGVDGAGKSTIIEAVKTELEKKHRRRIIVIRHRPSILPIISAWKYGKKGAEERSISTLPRQGKNSSKLSSFIRFAYYLCDYIIGQWIIHFRYVRKNTIVLYDRYYFDFINDSRRSNIALNPSFTEKFYFLIKKPEFNYFLWAAPDVILKRKQELDKDTIITLTNQYTELFARLQNADKKHIYRCIENVEIGETVESIMRNVVGNTSNETPIHPTHSSTKS